MASRALPARAVEEFEEDDYEDDTVPAHLDDLNDTQTDNFKVVIRVRPPLPRELAGGYGRPYQCTAHVDASHRILTVSENLPAVLEGEPLGADGLLYSTYRFTFDHIYDQHDGQEALYKRSAQQVVLSALQGYNAAIIAYGQTGTGKTYTMEGGTTGAQRGIIPRTVEDIFTFIVNDPEPSSKYLVRASYLQIYNEVISDLLRPERTNLTIREDKRRGVYVDALSEWVVRSPAEVYSLLDRGQAARTTGATKLNEVSSRSHAVCIIIVEKCATAGGSMAALAALGGAGGGSDSALSSPRSSQAGDGAPGSGRGEPGIAFNVTVGKLNLVDLAGSERVHVTGATGKRLEESKKINASLSALGNVIAALTARQERNHIPYRDSKLTRILEDSLGGNCKTTMICTISPSLEGFSESLSTLKFANRAKNIKNEAHVNEDADQRTLLRKYEKELKRLRAELKRRKQELVDKRALLQAEEQKRRAEADKLAALSQLERQSRQFLQEKEEKRKLEAKIQAMQSQLLMGGADGQSGPALRAAIARDVRSEYEARLRELEAERQVVMQDRQQVDRYKQLLLKQRDIMIALTARLNDRDSEMNKLQEEVETFEKYIRQLEDSLDSKTSELIALRKAAVQELQEHGAGSGTGEQQAAETAAAMHATAALTSALGAWGHGSSSQQPGGAAAGGRAPSGQAAGSVDGERPSTSSGSSGGVASAMELAQVLSDSAPGKHYASAEAEIAAVRVRYEAAHVELCGQLEEKDVELRAAQADAARLRALLESTRPGGLAAAVEAADDATQARVARLAEACRAAHKERAALQQILDLKVRRIAQELLAYADNNSGGDVQQGGGDVHGAMAHKLRALEQLVSKTVEAIRFAPPLVDESDL